MSPVKAIITKIKHGQQLQGGHTLVGRHCGTRPSGTAPGLTLTSYVNLKKLLLSQMLLRI